VILIPVLLAASLAAQTPEPGPKVGARIPSFALQDQDGKTRSLKDLTGPKGLMLVFTRSADW
jgi:hypothetical protein